MTEKSPAKKKVSLVLGSGGARGLAHIGVINWLEENDFRIVAVSGSSIGALVGGIYAIGKLEEYEHWVRAITTKDILRLLDITFDRDGLVSGDRVIDTLRDLIGDSQIEDLPIPFTAVATNVATEKEVWLNSGSLFDAIRASISLPLFFKPAVIDGVQLLDGGILNPVPIAPTFNDESDLTIAVNLCGRREAGFKLPEKKKQPEDEADFGQKIAEFIKGLDITKKVTVKRNGGMLDIASQTFDAMQGAIARQRLSAYPADIEISISKSACKILDFDRADELIQLGYETAEQKLGPMSSGDSR